MMSAEDFVRIYGEHVPRLCIDTAVIGPDDGCDVVSYTKDFAPIFSVTREVVSGIALKERDEKPRLGQWGLPGGTMFKGEHPFDASVRIIKAELGIGIYPMGSLGFMWFPNEGRQMMVGGVLKDFVIDSCSIVILARAQSCAIKSPKGKNVGWFKSSPPVEHEIHTPFLKARGLLS